MSSIITYRKHVAFLAFPFGSHPQNHLNLLRKFANSAPDILFSFFNTQNSNNSLFSSSSFLGLNIPPNVKIYNVEDGTPVGYRFRGNPLEPVDLFLKVAHQNIKRTTEKAVAETGIKITCIISDVFLTFSGDIAKDFDASWIAVWTALPVSLSIHLYTDIIREKCAGEKIGQDEKVDFVPGLSMLRVKDLPAELFSVGKEESAFSKELSRIGEVLPKATCVTVNCFQELVPEDLNNDLKSKFKNYLSLGFLSTMPENSNSNSDATGCLLWLDTQPSKSVAYIAFGTMAALPEKELKALAEALESSKIPFLWSLKDNLKEKLPNGFVERTSKEGKIVAWTPQTAVLAHDSVGVFISHGGYNSVSESIVHGVPMICRPFFGDQMTMARMVEVGWGMGVTVEDGVIIKNGLLKKLDIFFNDDNENGKKIRDNVEQLKKTVLLAALPNGGPDRDFSKLMGIITMV